MHRFIIAALILSCVILSTHGFDTDDVSSSRSLTSRSATNLLEVESGRRKSHHYYDYYDIYPYYGWHALTWVYWIKVKIVVAAFFAYTAFIWALQYVRSYYNKCSNDGGHHIYYNKGYYRSFDDDVKIPEILQQIGKSRKRRHLWKNSASYVDKDFS